MSTGESQSDRNSRQLRKTPRWKEIERLERERDMEGQKKVGAQIHKTEREGRYTLGGWGDGSVDKLLAE